ncbi:hypothetical protein K435DRAFT_853558 [Dendrothele bispora CBS 962.96]|uniref:UBA domain-containing protein n=1 Tax=Dendrothele bispora (strain CBS 962.96) TaxID=1314807 RepID=A0A4S8MGD3_DENBC|nr:hypothetical protein K435DRAFT_853558 [Dendrothele bispora CBS 962.96]
MTQMTHDEQENATLLASMAATDEGTALRVLRKHNGSVEEAANALLSGDRGSSPQKVTGVDPSATVIDLTAEDNDEEMNRTLQMSMNDAGGAGGHLQTTTYFGPSNRPPDANWAIVPSNVAPQPAIQEDENLKEASIKSILVEPDNEAPPPTEDMIRDEDGRPRPVALRPDDLVYASLVLHALFHVPQVRQRLSRFKLSSADQILQEDSAAPPEQKKGLVTCHARVVSAATPVCSFSMHLYLGSLIHSEDNSFKGVVALGCVPVDLSL